MLGIVWLWNVWIASRIPLIVIDSVQNADDVIAAVPEDAVETKPEFRRLNFASVARADGRNQPAEHQAAFEVTDSAPVLEGIDAHQIPPETEARQPARIEDALVGEIVDGEYRRHVRERGRRASCPQQQRDETRLPVVSVNDIETFRYGRRPLEC